MKKKIVTPQTLPPQRGINVAIGTLFAELATRASSHQDFLDLYNSLPNPDPVLRKAGQGIDILRGLTYDSHVSGAIASRTAGVMELKWSVARGLPETPDVTLIRSVWDNIDVPQFISDVLEAPHYGNQPIEIIWSRRSDRAVVPVSLIAKPQELFDFDSLNRFRYRGGSQPVLVHPYKFLVPRYRASFQNPYGQALLSSCYWPVTIKRATIKFNAVFVEKFAMPWPIIKYRPGMAIEEIEKLVRMVDNLVQDGILAVPEDSDLKLLQGTANGGREVYKVMIEAMNDEISKALLSHTGSIQSVGGKLGGEDLAGDVRDSLIREGKRLVEKTANDLIAMIYALNVGTQPPKNMFELYDEDDVNQSLSSRDWLLKEMGVVFNKEYYQREYGLNPEDFEIASIEQSHPHPPLGGPSAQRARGSVSQPTTPSPTKKIGSVPTEPTDPRRSLFGRLAALRRRS